MKVTVQVDGAVSRSGTVVGDFAVLSVTRLYVGAMPPTGGNTSTHASVSWQLPLHPTNNLHGCLRQVGY